MSDAVTGAVTPEPLATYRIQLTPEFGFDETIAVLDHLVELGISHVYLSPIGTAMPGSTHGYDWLPPPSVAEALGGLDGLRALRTETSRRGLGLIIDIVPNHTGVADALANPWFTDLLTHGVESAYADYFDINVSIDNGADGKIALPVLAADGDLEPLRIIDGRLHYYDHAYPIAPGTGDVGTPMEVHARQHYRLVPWNSGLIGYRRFFTVNELAGLRQEDPAVYDATHTWIRDLLAEDLIDGVRVDHPDGLWDPQTYLRRLRVDLGPDKLIYIEKILAPDEPLEPTLPVDGTTGYDQLRIIDGLFTAPSGVVELGEIHQQLTGQEGDGAWLHRTEHSRKLTTLAEMFPTEHRRLVRAITHSDPTADDDLVREASAEVIAGLGVYRADYPSLRPRLERVVGDLIARSPRLASALTTILSTTASPGAATSRLAQTCGAVTAKSVEDSLFYRTARLVSAQEVGGDPADPTIGLKQFHAHNVSRAHQWPRAMTAQSTHDTKRGEDVRSRIAMIAQVPGRWSLLVNRVFQSAPPPDRFTGYFLLQNIIGVWPVDSPVSDNLRERLKDYARKATREAGLWTSWTEVDEEFEAAVSAWIGAVTAPPTAPAIDEFVGQIAANGEAEALARKAISILAPGVPDIYQGTEWWDDSLVDPDNRRAVDYRQSMDHPKVSLIRTALSVRRDHADAFGTSGTYVPIHAEGPAADHAVVFARGVESGPRVIVATARFTHSLLETAAAATTVTLPDGIWIDAVSGQTHGSTTNLASLRANGPVAVLTRTADTATP